jgi:hypothetical protein
MCNCPCIFLYSCPIFLEYAGGLHSIALREGELGHNSHTQRTNTHTHPHTPTPLAREHRAKLLHFYICAKDMQVTTS